MHARTVTQDADIRWWWSVAPLRRKLSDRQGRLHSGANEKGTTMTDPNEPADLVPSITEAYLEHAAAEAQPTATPSIRELTSAEVVTALMEARAVGKLTVSGVNPVIVTGPDEDKELARAVLKGRGLTLTPYPAKDEWRRR